MYDFERSLLKGHAVTHGRPMRPADQKFEMTAVNTWMIVCGLLAS